ncbi:MAG: helix-turn-helix domain-containing protein [Actinomycetota bacterium]|nr:helix-turn-helix domain-containing protein [Actinomycetota bacterium]
MSWRPLDDDEREGWQVFGALLARTRHDAGLTQYQLACAAGMGERHLQRLEAGERRTRPSTLAALTDFLSRFVDTDADVLAGALLEVSEVTLAPESAYDDKRAVRWQRRARRAWFDECGRDHLARVTRRRSAPEEVKRRARATLYAMRENAGFPLT